MLGDKIGIFPLLYVELNDSAKQLIETDAGTGPGQEASPPSSPAPGPPSGGASVGAVGAIQRRVDGRKHAKKRHSFTALSLTHKAAQAASQRRSMEISAPVLISSSNPRAAARIGEPPHLSSSAPAQDSSSAGSGTLSGTRTSGIAGDQGPTSSAKTPLPLNIYLALYAYKPQKNDELELRKGEMYRVIEKCQDGWFKGTSLRTGISGVFPGNYVTPVSRVPLGGAGPARNHPAGGSPLAKGGPGAAGPGVGSLPHPAAASRPAVPVPQHQVASPPTSGCLRYSAQPAASPVRGSAQMAAHSSAQVPDRPTATVSPLRTPNSPSRLPASSIRPHPGTSPQLVQPAPAAPGAPGPRPVIPLTSAAAAITPPNVSAAHLSREAGPGPGGGPPTSSPTNSACKAEEKNNEKKEKKSGLLKLLAGASTKKKPRSPPSVSPTHDPLRGGSGPAGSRGTDLSSRPATAGPAPARSRARCRAPWGWSRCTGKPAPWISTSPPPPRPANRSPPWQPSAPNPSHWPEKGDVRGSRRRGDRAPGLWGDPLRLESRGEFGDQSSLG
uniref:SH3 domain-containing protein n=1 Tax=Ornithorhynchus anatinus TaxID=9258 RepID=A0A6I8P2Q5_ORNAN